MAIHTLNVHDELFIEKKNNIIINKDILFIDWVSTNDRSEKALKQLDVIKASLDIDNTSIIIFDRHRTMEKWEIDILKNKAVLWEPSVINREHFSFMPYWYDFTEVPLASFLDKQDDTVVITKEKYGVVPDISCTKNGTIPMLNKDNIWFYGIFNGIIARNDKDVDFIKKMYSTCGWAFARDLCNNMEKYLPQMKIDKFLDSIVSAS